MLPTDTREHTESAEDQEDATTIDPAAPEPPTARCELLFQRCLWCGTTAYRRSSCRACGSRAFNWERSEGSGVVVRRNGLAPHRTWFVAMDEGFTLLCEVTGVAPVVAAAGARVSVVRSVDPLDQGLPVVELTHPAPPLGRWW